MQEARTISCKAWNSPAEYPNWVARCDKVRHYIRLVASYQLEVADLIRKLIIVFAAKKINITHYADWYLSCYHLLSLALTSNPNRRFYIFAFIHNVSYWAWLTSYLNSDRNIVSHLWIPTFGSRSLSAIGGRKQPPRLTKWGHPSAEAAPALQGVPPAPSCVRIRFRSVWWEYRWCEKCSKIAVLQPHFFLTLGWCFFNPNRVLVKSC